MDKRRNMPFRMADSEDLAVVKVIGVGGGGGNAINTMVVNKLRGVEFIAANTDKQALNQSKADVCLQLGPSITKGLGAGADPEVGNMAAMESLEEITQTLKGSDMVFVTAGLGGGTGTGAAPVVARLSKEIGALTVAVVTKPFTFEGKLRTRNAEEGWIELQKYVDTIITVSNDRLLSIMQKNSRLSDMLSKADNVLLLAVKGITDLINMPGLINADFADLRTIMKEVGSAIMGAGSSSGKNRASKAAQKAIANQLLEDFGIDGARGLLINISAAEENFTMTEFMEASALIQERVDDDAKIVIGALYDNTLGDELRVTVIATGVQGVLGRKKTASPVGDNMKKWISADESNNTLRGPAASINKHPQLSPLPGSNFDSFNNSPSDSPEENEKTPRRWNEDHLETPAYLRKKDN